jgi:S-adenosylmethionine-diacylgycerolhomoserine-N-methlytransferase
MGQKESMGRMYRVQRHFYDLTRKYYLLGRDTALKRLAVQPGQQVLEMGCGTARNIAKMLRQYPEAKFFGLDASEPMLVTARANLDKIKGGSAVKLEHCLAEDLDYRKTFGCEEPFDLILFSYALSMIPTWEAAVETALNNLKPGGRIVVVDFWDQRGLPWLFRKALVNWLALFHVHHRPELLVYFQKMADEGRVEYQLEGLFRRYTYLATLSKPRDALTVPRPAQAACSAG